MRETCLYTAICSFFASQTVRHLTSTAVCWGCCTPKHPCSYFACANLHHTKFLICRLYSADSPSHRYPFAKKQNKMALIHYFQVQRENGENEEGLSCIKHLEMILHRQKHADKLLLSSLECEHVISDSMVTAVLSFLRLKCRSCVFFTSVEKIRWFEIPDLSLFTLNHRFN